MSTRTWDSSTIEGCLAELAYQREEFLRIHEQDCRAMSSLEKRAKRAEAKLAAAPGHCEEALASAFKPGDPCFRCGYAWPTDCECIAWNDAARARHARQRASSIVREEVVSEPGAGITITALHLSEEAQRRLCTNGARLPPTLATQQKEAAWRRWVRLARKRCTP